MITNDQAGLMYGQALSQCEKCSDKPLLVFSFITSVWEASVLGWECRGGSIIQPQNIISIHSVHMYTHTHAHAEALTNHLLL